VLPSTPADRWLRIVALPVVVLLTLATAAQTAPPPGWWTQRGVVQTNTVPDDFAVLNQGQLKTMARGGYDALKQVLPPHVWTNAPGSALTSLIQSWYADTNLTVVATGGDDFATVNLGQLKQVASKFYDVLRDVGYLGGSGLPPAQWNGSAYPWTDLVADDDNFAAANLGQAKLLFSFDPLVSTDSDALPDLWELAWFGSLAPTETDDSDGDNQNNLAEWQTGTPPKGEGWLPDTRLEIIGGTGQSGGTGNIAALPIVARVVQVSTGAPRVGVPVRFTDVDGGPIIGDGGQNVPTLVRYTDANGMVSARFRYGPVIGRTTMVRVAVESLP
jgi:hypothetical protein